MSPFVVHFTKKTSHNAYDNVMSILSHRRIEARGAFGLNRQNNASRKSVCFSETPPHFLARLAKTRGCFGIGFRKDLVVARGGGPIMYAYKDTKHARALRALVDAAAGKPADPIWEIAPFIDVPGSYGSKEYFFEWEREWRHVGDFDFSEKDAAFLIIPADDHELAREFFADAERDQRGPNYTCPYIDPYWNIEQVKEAFLMADSAS